MIYVHNLSYEFPKIPQTHAVTHMQGCSGEWDEEDGLFANSCRLQIF